jgi:hypothetical protein
MSSPDIINKKEQINIYPTITRRVLDECHISKIKELMSPKLHGIAIVHIAIKINKGSDLFPADKQLILKLLEYFFRRVCHGFSLCAYYNLITL